MLTWKSAAVSSGLPVVKVATVPSNARPSWTVNGTRSTPSGALTILTCPNAAAVTAAPGKTRHRGTVGLQLHAQQAAGRVRGEQRRRAVRREQLDSENIGQSPVLRRCDRGAAELEVELDRSAEIDGLNESIERREGAEHDLPACAYRRAAFGRDAAERAAGQREGADPRLRIRRSGNCGGVELEAQQAAGARER